jgi:hypothetical protein
VMLALGSYLTSRDDRIDMTHLDGADQHNGERAEPGTGEARP